MGTLQQMEASQTSSTENFAQGETSGCLDFILQGQNGEQELIHFILMTPESFKEMLPYAVQRTPLDCDIDGSELRTGF